MRRNKDFCRSENGMEAIEGLLVFTLMLFVLFYIWAFGFLFYQNWVVQFIANDTASRIAQTYAYDESDPITGFVSQTERAALSPYRYRSDDENFIEDENEERAAKYAKYEMNQTGFTQAKSRDIQVKTVYDSTLMRHIEVTVTGTYEIPFGFAMKYFGQSPYRTFTATGRAVCMDLQHYIYTTETVSLMGDIVTSNAGSNVISAVKSVISLIQSLRGGLKSLKSTIS